MTIAEVMEIVERALEASHPGLILQGYSSQYVDVSTPDGLRHFRITAAEHVPPWTNTDRGVAGVIDDLMRRAYQDRGKRL